MLTTKVSDTLARIIRGNSERARIARIILRHRYFPDVGLCLCSRDVPRTMEEHALHVADRIQRRRED